MENKIYTNILQSKTLAEILLLESADMYYSNHSLEDYYSPIPNIGNYSAIEYFANAFLKE